MQYICSKTGDEGDILEQGGRLVFPGNYSGYLGIPGYLDRGVG